MKTSKEQRDTARQCEMLNDGGRSLLLRGEALDLLADADLAAQLTEQLETLRTHPRVDDLLRVTEELRVARDEIKDLRAIAELALTHDYDECSTEEDVRLHDALAAYFAPRPENERK